MVIVSSSCHCDRAILLLQPLIKTRAPARREHHCGHLEGKRIGMADFGRVIGEHQSLDRSGLLYYYPLLAFLRRLYYVQMFRLWSFRDRSEESLYLFDCSFVLEVSNN